MFHPTFRQTKFPTLRLTDLELLFLETTAVLALGISTFIALGYIYGNHAVAAETYGESTIITDQPIVLRPSMQ
jgi:hypothetical protein